MDYRKTLNLPKTDFAMKAGLAQKEPILLKEWEKDNLYALIKKRWQEADKSFILHDGPPYANGHIHLGHALNKILKDFVIKYKTMRGYDSFYLPGWDCHGLPIEHQLFKEMKTDKSKVDRVEFRKKAYDYALKYVEVQKEEFKRLGVFGEWDHPYLTLMQGYEYGILHSLAVLNEKGFIYRGLKPVNWCFDCETALAEAEVEYEDHTSPSVYVKFKVKNPSVLKELPSDKPVYLMIWTTTPWTLLANVAVAVHQNYMYSIVDLGKDIFILEESLVDSVLSKGKMEDYKIIKKVKGKEITKLTYEHVFNKIANKSGTTFRVVAVDYVTREEGTGLVHTAPGHGQEDFETGIKYKLPFCMPVDHRGRFTEEGGEFQGEHVFKANDKIIENLREKGLLFYVDKVQHAYPHCWRCKKPIIFRATKQWFLNVDHDGLRKKMTDVIKSDVQWIPSSGQERILGMVLGRPDWCLSRQRYWGVPIPAVICRDCQNKQKINEPILDSAVIRHFAEVVKREGTDAWFRKNIEDLIPKAFKCPVCGKHDFEKTDDILDVWFDSGVSHQSVLRGMMHRDLPCDLYLEGSDQHRGWFQSSLIPAMAIEGKSPYRAVLTHGFTVDGQGRKMSKSLGNVIGPQEIYEKYGADILRLWVASSNYSEDVRLSKEILERLIDAYRKIRNTVRFMLSNLYDFHPSQDLVDYEKLFDIDLWVLSRLGSILNDVEKAYDQYEFDKVYRFLYSFCNEELSGVYLDILKDRLYISSSKSESRKAAQTALYYILDVLMRLMAPVLCFTAQEVFKVFPKMSQTEEVKNVHLLDWPKRQDQWSSSGIEYKLGIPLELRSEVLKALEKARQRGEIGSSLDSKVVIQTASDTCFSALKRNQDSLRYLFISSQVEVHKVESVNKGVNQNFPTTEIHILKAVGQKCSRCWNYSTLVGKDHIHPSLCERCIPVVKELSHV